MDSELADLSDLCREPGSILGSCEFDWFYVLGVYNLVLLFDLSV